MRILRLRLAGSKFLSPGLFIASHARCKSGFLKGFCNQSNIIGPIGRIRIPNPSTEVMTCFIDRTVTKQA